MKRASIVLVVAALVLSVSGAHAKPTKQEKQNKEVVLRATEALNRGDLAAYVSYFAEDTKRPAQRPRR